MATFNFNDPNAVETARQKAISAGYKPAEIDAYIKQQQTALAQQSLVASGDLKKADLAKTNPITAMASKAPPATATEPEVGKISAQQAGLAKSGLKNIEDVKKMYVDDPNLLTKQLVPGQFFSRKFDSALYDTVDALLRLRTGAQANPSEIRGYMNKNGPTFGDDPNTVQYKLQKLENDFKITVGKEPDAKPMDITKLTPKKTGNPLYDTLKANPISNFAIGEGLNVAQDIGAGARGIMEQGGLQQQELQAKQLEHSAELTSDPAQKQQFLAQANQLRQGISSEAGNIGQGFSENVGSPDDNWHNVRRGLLAATEIASTAQVAGQIPGAVKKGVSLFKLITNPSKNIGAYRDAAIQSADKAGVKISGDGMIEKLESIRKQVPSTELKQYDTMLQAAKDAYQGQTLSVSDAVGLNSHLNDAYTASGKVGKSASALVEKTLGDALKEGLKSQAPQVAHANKLFSIFFQTQKQLGKAINPLTIGMGAAGAGGAALYNMVAPKGQ